MNKRLLLNSVSSATLYAVNIIIAFIMSPIFIRALGNRDYGIWEILLSFCGYFGILDLGLGPAIIRFAAKESSLANSEALKRIFNSSFFGMVLAGFLCLIGMSVISINPDPILNLQPGEVLHLSSLCVLVGLNLFVQFPGTFFVAFLMGLQDYLLINVFRSVFFIGKAIVIFYALTIWEGPKLVWLATINLGSNLFQYATLATILFIRDRRLKFRLSYFSWSALKELYSFGLNSAMIMVSDRIQRQSLPVVIGHVAGTASIVFFALPKRLIEYATAFLLSVGAPLMPYFCTIDAERLEGERLQQWFPLSKAIAFLSLPLAAGLFFLGESFIHIWIGPDYAEKGRWVIIFLSISFLISGLFSNSGRVLVASGRHGPPARIMLLASIVTIALAIPLTAWWGVSGSAFAIMAGDIATVCIACSFAFPYVGIRLSAHFREIIKPLTIPFLIMLLCLAVGLQLFSDISYTSLIKIYSISCIGYIASTWLITLNRKDRINIKSRLFLMLAKISFKSIN